MSAPRVALVGFGRIAPKHLEALRGAGAEVVAACNRSASGRERAQHEGKIPRTFDRIDAMIAEVRPDAVVCTASFFEIFDVACQLIPFGIPTLLEKPPGTSLSEFEGLQRLVEKHQTPVMVGVNRRHYGVLNAAIADAGGPAALTHVDIDWSEDPAQFLGRGFTASQVGRMVFGNSLHGLDLITYLSGSIANPQIVVRKGSGTFDWNMALQGVSDRGSTVSFRSTWGSPGRWRLQFCSPAKRYVLAPLESCVVQQTGVKEERSIAPHPDDLGFKPGFLVQARALLDMVRTRRAPDSCSLEAVAPSMVLAERLTQALTS